MEMVIYRSDVLSLNIAALMHIPIQPIILLGQLRELLSICIHLRGQECELDVVVGSFVWSALEQKAVDSSSSEGMLFC